MYQQLVLKSSFQGTSQSPMTHQTVVDYFSPQLPISVLTGHHLGIGRIKMNGGLNSNAKVIVMFIFKTLFIGTFAGALLALLGGLLFCNLFPAVHTCYHFVLFHVAFSYNGSLKPLKAEM